MLQGPPFGPSYKEPAALVVELAAQLGRADGRIEALEPEVAALRARLVRDSTNSSAPPSADTPAAKGKRKVARLKLVRSKDRQRDGQPGRKGSGLSPTCTGCW